MKIKNLIILFTLISFLSLLSCDYNNENSNQKSQEKSNKEKNEGIDYLKKKTSESYKKPKDLEDKMRDLFTPDEVSPIRGFVTKILRLFKEISQGNFDMESFRKEEKAEKKEEKK